MYALEDQNDNNFTADQLCYRKYQRETLVS